MNYIAGADSLASKQLPNVDVLCVTLFVMCSFDVSNGPEAADFIKVLAA